MHLLNDSSKSTIELALRRAEIHLREYGELSHYGRIFEPDFANIPKNGIKSSGYVVDTLEAALWCLLTTDSYRECVLKAVNLGEDTDTIAAIAGGLAGALYGYEAIPGEWLDKLLRREYIEQLCERAAQNWR
jgi:ADP-ribosylglycohydrolase